jgi:DNA-binding protein YbaB
MKVTVLSDKSGRNQSVAVVNPELTGSIRVELEGGGSARQVDIDPHVIDPQALLGHKGKDAYEAAHEKLRRML